MRQFQASQVPRIFQFPFFGDARIYQAPKDSTDLEIGCGVGLHPIQYSLRHPDRYLIAVEHTHNKFAKFQRRFLNNGSPKNLLGINTNAISFVTHELETSCIENVLLHYPNPEIKNPAKRWFRMPFFSEILRVLKPEGSITLTTNIEAYFSEALKFANSDWHLALVSSKKIKLGDRTPITHFEKKYLNSGQICYEAQFKKQS